MQRRALRCGILRLAQLPLRIRRTKCLILERVRSRCSAAHKQKISGELDLSIISAGDLQFVSIHFSKSEMLTPCSTAGRWTRTVIVCLVAQSFDNVGAWIVGRNIFGPVRGPWKDESWKGWWGNNPPFHSPVFVLKHHARSPLSMEGGTTFYFVTNGPEAALKLAQEAA